MRRNFQKIFPTKNTVVLTIGFSCFSKKVLTDIFPEKWSSVFPVIWNLKWQQDCVDSIVCTCAIKFSCVQIRVQETYCNRLCTMWMQAVEQWTFGRIKKVGLQTVRRTSLWWLSSPVWCKWKYCFSVQRTTASGFRSFVWQPVETLSIGLFMRTILATRFSTDRLQTLRLWHSCSIRLLSLASFALMYIFHSILKILFCSYQSATNHHN